MKQTNLTKQKKSATKRTLDLVFCALGAVLITVCSWISIPGAVPFTLQTLGIFTVLLLLGGKRGTASICVYILLGAVGVPVFAGFGSGIGYLLGSTGGYLVGFVFIGLAYLIFEKLFNRRFWAEILSLILGLLLCYAFGTVWFMLVYAKANGEIALLTTLSWCVFPFILPDIGKMTVAIIISKAIKRYIKL